MFERAFVKHTTQDGTSLGLGAVWQEDGLFQVDLIETSQEHDWLARLSDEGRAAPRADESRSAPLWADLALRLEGAPGERSWALSPRGTVFQQRVREALLTIPCGQAWTYKALADAVGSTDGARAVAGGCASSPIALIVPCHRVVGGQGKLGGYRWGVTLKRRQLKVEGAKSLTA